MHGKIIANPVQDLFIHHYIKRADPITLSEIASTSVRAVFRIVKRYEEQDTSELAGHRTCGRKPQIDEYLEAVNKVVLLEGFTEWYAVYSVLVRPKPSTCSRTAGMH
ncbi:hypothetical protein SAICODRAFT_129578 [Saitoella complicata NRRL Y-17804]|uniref:uncharacterized protein n=1 Tax=Saitoella complicata (strain BCRC 22490 / CBS 7301 / JCM 7358 / NBRC 10748 / NRRL Y-17804) TaxID=698492 RepID=UPI0008674B84|nr:uncharacterized protein SAICODRAFT_129578 [Saitoella complicata NRRL Y-17804]ODQ52489.1 hypothetical protein SAICODRAFT_129578 [Saitoella complicata NRRL Y-17804]